ncbi:MAG TPA: hypothetical protein VMV95_02695 [Bacillota bacterium]|nr:hypothetical protein [Bacillota bacterium]
MKNKKGKIDFQKVEVEWTDITHLTSVPDIEYLKEQKFLHFKNLGYLIYEDKEMVSIAFSCTIYDKDKVNPTDKFRDVLNIPRPMIVKIIKLRGTK